VVGSTSTHYLYSIVVVGFLRGRRRRGSKEPRTTKKAILCNDGSQEAAAIAYSYILFALFLSLSACSLFVATYRRGDKSVTATTGDTIY